MERKLRVLNDPELDKKVERILAEPVGTPIDLTREEAVAIVEAGRGSRPDLPSGTEYVKRISKIWRWMLPRD